MGEDIELIDGRYCANNPTLYAIADAVQTFQSDREEIRLVSVGVGISRPEAESLIIRAGKDAHETGANTPVDQ